MNIFQVDRESYYTLIMKYRGLLFHQVDADKRYLIKPFKSIEPIIAKKALCQL